jgi:YgiT-type zinc finger domain-containing protein
MGAGLQDEAKETPVSCVVCHAGTTQPGTTTITFHREGRTVVINDVPAAICENCGEAYVDEGVTARVLELATEARESGVTVLVRDFEPAAA